MNQRTRTIVTIAAAFGLTAGATAARAAGFAIVEQGVSGLGNAYAGWAASAEDPSTIFYNAAGITRLKGIQASAGFHVIVPHAEFKNENSTHVLQPVTGQGLTGGDGGDGGVTAFVPNGYFTYNNGRGVAVGLGVFAPWGLKTDYPEDWVGRYHAVTSDMKTIDINPVLAVKPSSNLSLGIGFNIQYIKAKLSNMIDYGTIFAAAGGTPQQDDGKVTLKADDWGYGFNLGLLYEFSDATRLGLAYRSRIRHKLEGDADFSNPTKIQSIIDVAAPGLFADTGAFAKVTLPDTASLSLYHRYNDKLAVMADVTWTHWSLFEELRVEFENSQPDSTTTEEWEDAWRFSVGGTYTLMPALDLRCGLAYDQTPVPDAQHRTPRIPDGDRFWIALGAGYRIIEDLTLDAAYVHIFVKTGEVDKEATGEDTTRGGLKGEFKSSVDIASVQLTYRF
jgi:long-chain fatty acid transport protein